MRSYTKTLLVFILFTTLAGYSQVKEYSPVIIEGRVIDETTGKPLKKIHVFIIEGEEEALTNNKGEFRIESWQKFPIKLTVNDYLNFRKTSTLITDVSKKQVIRLKN